MTVRSNKYLNNAIEQGHRRIKQRLRPMLSFRSFRTAAVVISGIELAEKIKKGQTKSANLVDPTATTPAIWQAALAAIGEKIQLKWDAIRRGTVPIWNLHQSQQVNLDLSTNKEFPIAEKHPLQLRTGMFNAPNYVELGNPATGWGNSNALPQSTF